MQKAIGCDERGAVLAQVSEAYDGEAQIRVTCDETLLDEQCVTFAPFAPRDPR